MSLPASFQTPEEVNYRYSGSIIFNGQQPIYVREGSFRDPEGRVKDGPVIFYQDVGLGQFAPQQVIASSAPALRDGPFNLGFINGVERTDEEGNVVGDVAFCTRMPLRKWKQGLTQQNLDFHNRAMTFNKALQHNGFVQMLQGTYPTMETVKEKIGKKLRRIAFHRHWAAGLNKMGTFDLFYRGQVVGAGGDAPDTVKLGPKFKYLQEAYEDAK